MSNSKKAGHRGGAIRKRKAKRRVAVRQKAHCFSCGRPIEDSEEPLGIKHPTKPGEMLADAYGPVLICKQCDTSPKVEALTRLKALWDKEVGVSLRSAH